MSKFKTAIQKSKFSNDRYGFTLIEMLISISIFMIFIGLIASSFTTLVRANREANNMQKLYRELTYVFDTIAQKIRSGKLDYSCITGQEPTCTANSGRNEKIILGILHDGDTKRSLYKFNENSKKIEMKKQRRQPITLDQGNPWVNDSNDWQSMTSNDFPAQDFYFSVFPSANPYSNNLNDIENDLLQWQPSVGVYLKTTDNMEFRSTYSSRTYGEKQLYKTL